MCLQVSDYAVFWAANRQNRLKTIKIDWTLFLAPIDIEMERSKQNLKIVPFFRPVPPTSIKKINFYNMNGHEWIMRGYIVPNLNEAQSTISCQFNGFFRIIRLFWILMIMLESKYAIYHVFVTEILTISDVTCATDVTYATKIA